MSIGTLNITVYETSSGPYRTENILQPSWEQVEEAIRAPDRDLHPFIWLYRDEVDEDYCDPADFEAIGGQGAYHLAYREDEEEWNFQDPAGAEDEVVEVWISDQGAAVPARNVCRDLEQVLRATRVFFDEGTRDPATPWIKAW
jgi:hypothetical protein